MSKPIDDKIKPLYDAARELNKVGGAAFPASAEDTDHSGHIHRQAWTGMSLRDYFAAKAMVAIIAQQNPSEDGSWMPEETASDAYQMADAMLAVRGAS